MKNQPYMTVFTPAYNRAHTLPRLYESLKNQTTDGFEWIVINDGSTDGTEELLEKWSGEDNRFDFSYLTVENGGKPRAINRGVTMARGKYFFLVDSDDYLTPDAVEKMTAWAKETENDPAFIGVGAAKALPTENISREHRRRSAQTGMQTRQTLNARNTTLMPICAKHTALIFTGNIRISHTTARNLPRNR